MGGELPAMVAMETISRLIPGVLGKPQLLKERISLEDDLKRQGIDIEQWVELSEKTFNFARYARIWFENGDQKSRRAIFACLGDELIIKDQKLQISLKKPFEILIEQKNDIEQELVKVEPLTTSDKSGRVGDFRDKSPLLSG